MKLPRGWRRLRAREFEGETVELARALLGKVLVHETSAGIAGGRIVETEAYLASGDAASHSHRGRSARNASMFARAGTAYVYFVYGMHSCFNVASAREGCGEAVLVRALEPLLGLELMRSRRPGARDADLCRGPANLVRALGITLDDDGADLARGKLAVFSTGDPGDREPRRGDVVAGPRVGITRASELPLRFHLRGSPWVSKPPKRPRARR